LLRTEVNRAAATKARRQPPQTQPEKSNDRHDT
jgi:hypothetical protein